MEIKIDTKKIEKKVAENLAESSIVEDIIQDVLEEDEIRQHIKNIIRQFIVSSDGAQLINEIVKSYIENTFDITDESELMDVISDSIKKTITHKFNL